MSVHVTPPTRYAPLHADGRSGAVSARAYVNGRSASAGDLSELAGELLAFYGQH